MRTRLCTADASTTEEPEAGKLPVRDCTGGPGNRHSYRRGSVFCCGSPYAANDRIPNLHDL